MQFNRRVVRWMLMAVVAMGLVGAGACIGLSERGDENGTATAIDSNFYSAPDSVNVPARYASLGTSNGAVAGQLSAVEKTVAGLALTCAPTAAEADRVEAALADMLTKMGYDPAVAAQGQTTSTAPAMIRSIIVAHQLSQVLQFMFLQQEALAKAAYRQQATAQ